MTAKPGKLSAERWIEEGFNVLREHGEDALTIDRLCHDLSRTKGSFYHHFEDLSAYLDALLEAWEARDTSSVIEHADSAAGVDQRRARLEQAVHGVDTRLDVAVRAWGLRDARAGVAVQRVDARRIDYLAGLYRAQAVPSELASRLARIEYAAFVGAEQLFADLAPQVRSKLERTLHAALQALVTEQAPRRRTGHRS